MTNEFRVRTIHIGRETHLHKPGQFCTVQIYNLVTNSPNGDNNANHQHKRIPRQHEYDFTAGPTGRDRVTAAARSEIAKLVPPDYAQSVARQELEALRSSAVVGDVLSPINESWNAVSNS